MAIINRAEHGMGMEVRNKVGAPSAYGAAGYGIFEYGCGAKFFGIYQIRTRPRGKIVVKEKYYVPTNPQTPAQQAWRANLADAIAAWKALTPNEKSVYNERTKYKHISGINLFTREYLLSL